MGQRNYELLNKAPNYVFWSSMWNSVYCFKNNLYLDFFLKNVIYSVFSSNSSQFFFKNLKLGNINYLYNRSNHFIFDNVQDKGLDFVNPYLSKVWLLLYKNWLFLTFFIFYPKGKIKSDDIAGSLDETVIDFFFFNKIKQIKQSKKFNVYSF